MITAEAVRSRTGLCTGYRISGHGEMDTAELGYDIVCAAVSAVTLTAALGLRDALGIDGSYESESGLLTVDIHGHEDARTEAVIATMFRGLEEIRKQYPDRILIKEHGR